MSAHPSNKNTYVPKFGSRGYSTGDYRRKVFLDCMTCELDTAEVHRICCDRIYCQPCSLSCCEHNNDLSYSRNLSSTKPASRPLSKEYIVPEPYPPPPFPYFFHEAYTSNLAGEMRITHRFKNLRDLQQNPEAARSVVHFYVFDKTGKQVHAGVHRTKPEEP